MVKIQFKIMLKKQLVYVTLILQALKTVPSRKHGNIIVICVNITEVILFIRIKIRISPIRVWNIATPAGGETCNCTFKQSNK